MDNLVLIRVVRHLRRSLERAALADLREESSHRFRLLWTGETGQRTVLISLRPELPWIGRPVGSWPSSQGAGVRFAAVCRRALKGSVLTTLEKSDADRVVFLRFAGGESLVAELATHRANLVLLDGRGRVSAAARRPRRSPERYLVGSRYEPPQRPRGLLDPFRSPPEAIDRALEARVAAGDTRFEALRRGLFGVGSAGARLVDDEARACGRSAGKILKERIDALTAGALDPLIEAPGDEGNASGAAVDPGRLLPWEPVGPPPSGHSRSRGADPAQTAGRWYESGERRQLLRGRIGGLQLVLRGEIRRAGIAAARAAVDLESFDDPERHARHGEALLAGLAVARRSGERVFVPDPFDPAGAEIAIPVEPGKDLRVAAEEFFRRRRRAHRGRARARDRIAEVTRRRDRLEALAGHHAGPPTLAGIEELEREMRRERIPVGLEPPTRAGRDRARVTPPRLEGVRLLSSSEGETILVGRSRRDNHRLTFKLGGPEDFWFHALAATGAHVLVRNPERGTRPSVTTLHEAAAVAAWFSEARNQPLAEVQWTRRKYVRRPRGAAVGTVTIKRFETVRVRPALPGGASGTPRR